MPFRCLFHLHTRCSFDSILSPAAILARARELHVDVLIVTDHNTIQGSRNVQSLTGGDPPLVVTAAEYQSDKGDIIGLFLKEEIRSHDSRAIIQQIHDQGGLVVLPHPYRAHQLDEDLLAGVDLIESHNSRCSESENARAAELAQKVNRPVLGGADAHCSMELGSAMNEFAAEAPKGETELRHSLLHAPRRIVTQRVSPLCPAYSQMVKAVKTKDPILFLSQAKRITLFLARNAVRENAL
ncbi:MAG: PHP domain-containing protein [Acidobacteriia bacterium]|nr:PHP domain-containing protein [Terriglobia bacterium]